MIGIVGVIVIGIVQLIINLLYLIVGIQGLVVSDATWAYVMSAATVILSCVGAVISTILIATVEQRRKSLLMPWIYVVSILTVLWCWVIDCMLYLSEFLTLAGHVCSCACGRHGHGSVRHS